MLLVVPLHYRVHGTRKLPYKDVEFDLIIDKGPVDAMILDEKDRYNSFIKIVVEAARLISINSLFVVILLYIILCG